MDEFVQLKQLAVQVGAADAVAEYESRCASISSREHTGVVIAGGSNCGKTTVLNGITGIPLRETSNIPGDEPPLRVTFEKMADLEGFDCRTVLNKHWNAENAILYEMKQSDLIDDTGRPKQLLDLADVVFYVISALTPFTREDMEIIKSLSPVRVKVVLNKLSLVRDADQSKVEAYVAGICAKLGVDTPLVIQGDDWDRIAKGFRDALPISSELTLYRRNHIDAIYQDAVKMVIEQAQQRMNAVQISVDDAYSKQAENELEFQRKRAEWNLLKAEMLEKGAAHCAARREVIMARKAAVAEKLLAAGKASGFSEAWFENELSKQMRHEMEAIVEENIPQIEAFMRSDCEEMINRAVHQGLITADTCYRIDFEPLTRIGIDYSHSIQLHDTIHKGSVQIVRADKVPTNMKLLIGTAAACALVYLIYPSTLLTFVPAGIGGVIMGIDGQSRKTVEWSKALSYYTEKNLSGLGDTLDDGIRNYYDILAETIVGKVAELTVTKADEDRFSQEEKKLSAVIQQCRILLKN